jgi:hypothetical protein
VYDLDWFKTPIENTTPGQFLNQFEDLYVRLQRDRGFLAFAMIIYDETIPEMKKALRDKDFWMALDKTSGYRLIVFTLRDKEEHEYKPDNTSRLMTAMPMNSHEDYGKRYSKILKTLFQDEALLAYPSVLFFQVVDGTISKYSLVPLSRGTQWEVFQRLQNLLGSIAEVLCRVTPENYKNKREIFNLIVDELKRQKLTLFITQGPKRVADFVSILRTLFFI